jgi:hypothetical protein
MELPDDILGIVRDFSRPLTRPDWRHLHRMSMARFHNAIQFTYNVYDIPVVESFVDRYDQNYYVYLFHNIWIAKPVLYLRINIGH